MTRMGFNVNAQGMSVNDIADLWRRSGRPSSLLLLASDNGRQAQEVQQATGAIVVARANWPDDKASYPGELPGQWVDNLASAPDVYWYYPNEPNPQYLDHFLDETCDFMAACNRQGIKFCIGNFAWPQILQQHHVDAGVWDGFLRAAHRYARGGKGYIGGHEYTMGALPWGCAGRNPADMTGGQSLPGPEQWPDIAAIRNAGAANWHLFRWIMLEQRAARIGLSAPWCNMLVTECFWDRMPDLEQSGVAQRLDALAGQKVAGIRSSMALFTKWWPEHSERDSMNLQLEWAERSYPSYVHGFHLFTVSRDPQWHDYDFTGILP